MKTLFRLLRPRACNLPLEALAQISHPAAELMTERI